MDEAFQTHLARPFPKILAWDLDTAKPHRVLALFSREAGGAQPMCDTLIHVDEISALTLHLKEQGHMVGSCDRSTPFVWWVSAEEVLVWDEHQQVLHAHNQTIELLGGICCPRSAITQVQAFVSPTMVSRGVEATVQGGSTQLLVLHQSTLAQIDPTYDRHDLIFELAWVSMLGQAIAQWCEVMYQERPYVTCANNPLPGSN